MAKSLLPRNMRPATEAERAEDYQARLRALENAHLEGRISEAQYERQMEDLGSFEGYPRPIEEHVYVEVLLRIKGSPIENHIVDVRVPNTTVPLTEADTTAAPEATKKLSLNIPKVLRDAAKAVQMNLSQQEMNR